MWRPRLLLGLVLTALLIALAGCGGEDFEAARDRVEERFDERIADARQEFQERRERFGKRIEQVLGDLEQVVPRAERTSPTVRSQGSNEPQTIDEFMKRILTSIDGYWTRTFAAADLPEPRVGFSAIPPGGRRLSSCGTIADDSAAFYCPADDTIYVAQQFAADLYGGVVRELPGAAGDFAVSYVLAHEYAHNLQQELGTFDNAIGRSARPFELQADCLAGVWAFSVYEQGLLEPGDIEEATNAALVVGDFDVGNAQHHGTPDERRAALLTGFETGEPASCNRFVAGA